MTGFHLRRSICLLKKKMITSLGEPVLQRDTVTTNRSFMGVRCTNYYSVTAHHCGLHLKATIQSTSALDPLTMPPLSVLVAPLDPIESAALRLRTATSRANIRIGTAKKPGNRAEIQPGTECAGPSSSARFPAQTMGSITCR